MFICWDFQCKMNNTALDFVQTFKGALDKYNIILRLFLKKKKKKKKKKKRFLCC